MPLHHYRMDAVLVSLSPFSTETVGSSESGTTSLVNVLGGHTAGSTETWGEDCPSVSVHYNWGEEIPVRKARGPRRNADRQGDSAGVAPSTPHPRPVMVPRLSPALGEGGVRVFHSCR